MACQNCIGISLEDPRFAMLDEKIAGLRPIPGSLINVLHQAQQLFGFLPEEVIDHVAREMELPASEVYGVVTFYNLFNTEPVGRFPISICMGTACYVKGADRLVAQISLELGIKPGEVTDDGLFSLETCRCIGACGLAPVLTVGGEVHGKLTEGDVRRLLAEYRAAAIPAAASIPPEPALEPELVPVRRK